MFERSKFSPFEYFWNANFLLLRIIISRISRLHLGRTTVSALSLHPAFHPFRSLNQKIILNCSEIIKIVKKMDNEMLRVIHFLQKCKYYSLKFKREVHFYLNVFILSLLKGYTWNNLIFILKFGEFLNLRD